MKRKSNEIVEIVDDCNYINCYLSTNEPCIVRDNCKKDDLVWAARKTDGFQFFPATIYDVNPADPETVHLTWTDLTQNDLFVNVRYTHNFDRVEEWLLNTSNYYPPPDRTF